MSKITKRIKRVFVIIIASITVSFLMVPPLRAQTDLLLAEIAQTTSGILTNFNAFVSTTMPFYVTMFYQLGLSWAAPDDSAITVGSENTPGLQARFANSTNAYIANDSLQKTMLDFATKNTLLSGVTPTNLPYANDLAYQTLLGSPLFTPDPRKNVNPTYNYFKNISGLSIQHAMPSAEWKGSQTSKNNYINYYSSVMAIESYDIYTLSQLLSDGANQYQFSQNQNDLIKQAGDSDWFAQVATEKMGMVLRQLLMFESQIYVLLTQLLTTEKQLLASQAMNNTLLIMNSSTSESLLLKKATGELPQ